MTMKNESGRSMVEMLGVLAIIGVLSIGGIAGYTMAMNRYRANEIIDAASKLAIIAQTKNAGVGGTATWGTDLNGTIPCLDTTSGKEMTSTRYGKVTLYVQNDCKGVAEVIGTLKGTCSTTDNKCELNFGDAS